MNPSIPASAIVQVVPGVIGAGGSALDLQGLILTTNTRVPVNQVLAFASVAAVNTYFGPTSDEAATANVYFGGFTNSNIKPGSILFTQYPATPVAAYLRGGSVATMTLAQLQALTGTLTVVMDGYTHAATTFSLSAATSFSNAATLIQAALDTTEPTEATCTSGTIAGSVLTVSGTITGVFAVGQTLTGTSVTSGTKITSLGTGTGGAGTYNLSASSTVSVGELITATATALTVTYDSVSGAFVVTSGIAGAASSVAYATGTLAAPLMLTAALGAVLSQGAAATAPGAFMSGITAITTNWATFMTMYDPDGGSGNANKMAFAAWSATQNNRYMYVCMDSDITPTASTSAATSMGYLLAQSASSGICLIYAPASAGNYHAAFICGSVASLDFTEHNGRATMAFKGQSGLLPAVTDQTAAANLIANGYNFYGVYATANDQFTFFNPGSVSGEFKWADSYVNQIWLNNAFQLALMTLLTQLKSVPYNNVGYGLIRAALMDPISQGLNFGAFQAGVPLSALQAAEINNAAGLPVDKTLYSQGWYLQILPATAQVRGQRKTPPMTFWYMDGGSVQNISLASIEVQ